MCVSIGNVCIGHGKKYISSNVTFVKKDDDNKSTEIHNSNKKLSRHTANS